MSNITKAVDEVIDLKVRAVEEWLKETVEPLLKEVDALNKKMFEKAYKEVKELEEEVNA